MKLSFVLTSTYYYMGNTSKNVVRYTNEKSALKTINKLCKSELPGEIEIKEKGKSYAICEYKPTGMVVMHSVSAELIETPTLEEPKI